MDYVIDPTADEPIMVINQHIGEDEDGVMGVNSSLFCQSLLQLDAMGKKAIKVYINSPGGDVDGGMGIYHAILQTKAKVDTYNVFMACSIAAVIFEAGRTRYMADYALLMFHSPRRKDGSDTGKVDPVVELFRASTVKAIAARSGQPEELVDKMLNKDTWIDADTAIKTGFADEIQESADYNKKRITVPKATAAERSNYVALFNKGDKILNSIIKKPLNMSKITAALDLQDEAAESSIVASISALKKENIEMKAKIKADDDDMEDMKAKLTAAEKVCADLKTKMKASDDAAAKMKAETEEADLKAKDEKAEALVATHDRAGRIKYTAESKEKVLAFYKKQAIEAYDDTKEILEAMTINKQATQMPHITTLSEVDMKHAGSAAARMIEIQARTKAKLS